MPNCNLDRQQKFWNSEIRKETDHYENDLSAEKKTENEGTWFQKENVHQEWQKRAQEKKSKRQKEINCLILWCRKYRRNYAEKKCFKKKEWFFCDLQ